MAGTVTQRRGRPRRVASSTDLEPREEILREAARRFSTQGVAGTRMTDIAAGVGISSPTLYYYFENLEQIVEALLAYVVDESAAFATAAAREEGPCAARLESLVTQHVQRLTSGPYDLWFVVGPSQASSAHHPTIRQKAEQWRSACARLIAEGVRRGEFTDVDPGLAVGAVMGLVYAALQLRHNGATVEPPQVARLAVSCLTPRS